MDMWHKCGTRCSTWCGTRPLNVSENTGWCLRGALGVDGSRGVVQDVIVVFAAFCSLIEVDLK